MTKDKDMSAKMNRSGPAGFVMIAAWVGAAVYFVHQSHGFWGFILAVFKACVWPAYIVYHALLALHA